MQEPKAEHTKIDRLIAAEMQQDITMLSTKAITDAALFLAHPEWHDKMGVMLPKRKLKGGLDERLDEAYETLLPPAVKRVETVDNASDVTKRIRKIFHHINSIMKARTEFGERTVAAVDSHMADYDIEMRELQKVKLPQSCFTAIELAYDVCISKQDEQRKWRQNAQFKDYVDQNDPATVGSGITSR